MTVKRPILELDRGELAEWLGTRSAPPYRARQIFDWIFERRAVAFDAMSDLPKALREQLDAEFEVFGTKIGQRSVATDGTEKLLLECQDGRRIEAVLMHENERRTICISSQVGCGMGCVFCASGLKGVERNLTAAEILEEILRLRNLLPADERLTNIVVMGMGESLANLDNLVQALDRVCSVEGLGLSQRRVTISTVGLPEKIRKLAQMDRQYHLAVSLHAPTKELREQLVPINAKVGLDAVMEAADFYFAETGRQVTFEYVMLRGLNDRPEDSRDLSRLMRARKAHVNLIPYNPVDGLPYERPLPSSIDRFTTTLRGAGVSVSVRKTKGKQIDAACGQLRRRAESQRNLQPDRIGIA